jgi:hypothetical protein
MAKDFVSFDTAGPERIEGALVRKLLTLAEAPCFNGHLNVERVEEYGMSGWHVTLGSEDESGYLVRAGGETFEEAAQSALKAGRKVLRGLKGHKDV